MNQQWLWSFEREIDQHWLWSLEGEMNEQWLWSFEREMNEQWLWSFEDTKEFNIAERVWLIKLFRTTKYT